MQDQTTPPYPKICQICRAMDLREVKNFCSLARITSDCRSFEAGGRLFVCFVCGGVQKLPDVQWLREIEGIYSNYKAYYQSGGDEQIVFDRSTGIARRRSDVILDRLAAGGWLGSSGQAMDVGCGNGVTLGAMSRMWIDWSFSGYELSEGSYPLLSAIPRFEKLYTGSLEKIGRSFDLVTMIHSLEHFRSPGETLNRLLPIVGSGYLFIEVSNIEENPFDILIADHLMHFSPSTLLRLLTLCGFESKVVATDWVPKEISLLTELSKKNRYLHGSTRVAEDLNAEKMFDRMTLYVDWLGDMVDQLNELTREKTPLGIFGTSIAGTWLATAVTGSIDFFVDEDPSRIGREHGGKPIFHPSQVPEGAKVYFALAPGLAEKVAVRVQSARFQSILPPRFGAA